MKLHLPDFSFLLVVGMGDVAAQTIQEGVGGKLQELIGVETIKHKIAVFESF